MRGRVGGEVGKKAMVSENLGAGRSYYNQAWHYAFNWHKVTV